MSQSEVDRFIDDLKADDSLRAELAGQASGVASVVSFAAEKGYDVTPEEVTNYIRGQVDQELTDGQLDAIAGGKGHHHHHHHSLTSTYAAQTVAIATTEAVAAETSVNLAAEVEIGAAAAVVAAAAAVVVVVAT